MRFLVTDDGTDLCFGTDEPVRKGDCIAMGEGCYTIRRPDGSVLRRWRIWTNRNSNLAATRHTPADLEGVTTAALRLLERDFVRIVRVWPAKRADLDAVRAELAHREQLLARPWRNP